MERQSGKIVLIHVHGPMSFGSAKNMVRRLETAPGLRKFTSCVLDLSDVPVIDGTAQYHINADIMYALRKYVHATGDEEFLKVYGSEMLAETARLWADLGFFSKRKGGKFCINGVTGPDEYNTVVNNNVYTNLMARENLRYAADTIEWLREKDPDAYTSLVNKINLDVAEVEKWKTAANAMFLPYDEQLGIHPQDESFLDKEPWDFENTPRENIPCCCFITR